MKKFVAGFVVSILLGMIFTALAWSAAAQNTVWNYRTKTDEVTGKTISYASVTSTNTVEFGFPYQGIQTADLVLRKHPRWGSDVLFGITAGQFLCNGFEGCTVIVRFDNSPPVQWQATTPQDMSTNVIFLQSERSFVARVKKAKTLRIAAQFYQEGEKTFIFNVAGLRW